MKLCSTLSIFSSLLIKPHETHLFIYFPPLWLFGDHRARRGARGRYIPLRRETTSISIFSERQHSAPTINVDRDCTLLVSEAAAGARARSLFSSSTMTSKIISSAPFQENLFLLRS